jgi:predicted PurR-regulated permease PerM
MENIKENDGGNSVNFIVLLAALFVVIAGLKMSQSLIVPILLSVFIAIISAPALFWLESKKVPRILAFIIVVVVVLGVLSMVGMVIGNSINDFMSNLPEYEKNLSTIPDKIGKFAARFKLPFLKGDIKANLLKQLDPSFILGFSGTMLGGLGNLLSNAMLIFLTVAFILFESSSFSRKLERVSQNALCPNSPVGTFLKNLNSYLAIKTVTSLVTGLLVAFMLYLFEVDYPLLWGLMAFFLNFIPSIGSIIAAVPAVLLALVQFGVQTSLWVALCYGIINGVIGNIIEPRFMGKGLGLSPLVVFLSLVFWGWVLGPVGMFLSVPLTMTAKIACDSNKKTKIIGVFLGP